MEIPENECFVCFVCKMANFYWEFCSLCRSRGTHLEKGHDFILLVCQENKIVTMDDFLVSITRNLSSKVFTDRKMLLQNKFSGRPPSQIWKHISNKKHVCCQSKLGGVETPPICPRDFSSCNTFNCFKLSKFTPAQFTQSYDRAPNNWPCSRGSPELVGFQKMGFGQVHRFVRVHHSEQNKKSHNLTRTLLPVSDWIVSHPSSGQAETIKIWKFFEPEVQQLQGYCLQQVPGAEKTRATIWCTDARVVKAGTFALYFQLSKSSCMIA